MRIHLVTLVGVNVDVFPFMLEHYRALAVDSFVVNLHLRCEDDPILDDVREITARYGCEVAWTFVGDFHSQQERVWRTTMQLRPNDWCVLAEQDELHRYPDELRSVLSYCDRKGYDYVCGCFVDRISADGRFAAVDRTRPIGDQFPLGGALTFPMLGADPRKVVAAKGRIPVVAGQHLALDGTGCPVEDVFVQVHHFKWTAGLVERLRERSTVLRTSHAGFWRESDRFVKYVHAHQERIDLTDPRFLIAPCDPVYPHWSRVTKMVMAHRDLMRHRGVAR